MSLSGLFCGCGSAVSALPGLQQNPQGSSRPNAQQSNNRDICFPGTTRVSVRLSAIKTTTPGLTVQQQVGCGSFAPKIRSWWEFSHRDKQQGRTAKSLVSRASAIVSSLRQSVPSSPWNTANTDLKNTTSFYRLARAESNSRPMKRGVRSYIYRVYRYTCILEVYLSCFHYLARDVMATVFVMFRRVLLLRMRGFEGSVEVDVRCWLLS